MPGMELAEVCGEGGQRLLGTYEGVCGCTRVCAHECAHACLGVCMCLNVCDMYMGMCGCMCVQLCVYLCFEETEKLMNKARGVAQQGNWFFNEPKTPASFLQAGCEPFLINACRKLSDAVKRSSSFINICRFLKVD